MSKNRKVTIKVEGSVTADVNHITFTDCEGNIVPASNYNDCELNDLLAVGVIRVDLQNVLEAAAIEDNIELVEFEVN